MEIDRDLGRLYLVCHLTNCDPCNFSSAERECLRCGEHLLRMMRRGQQGLLLRKEYVEEENEGMDASISTGSV